MKIKIELSQTDKDILKEMDLKILGGMPIECKVNHSFIEKRTYKIYCEKKGVTNDKGL